MLVKVVSPRATLVNPDTGKTAPFGTEIELSPEQIRQFSRQGFVFDDLGADAETVENAPAAPAPAAPAAPVSEPAGSAPGQRPGPGELSQR